MTPRDRAKAVVMVHMDHMLRRGASFLSTEDELVNRIEKAITSALAEQREAHALIAKRYEGQNYALANDIAHAIRKGGAS